MDSDNHGNSFGGRAAGEVCCDDAAMREALYLGVPAALAVMAIAMVCNWHFLDLGGGRAPGETDLPFARGYARSVREGAPHELVVRGTHVRSGHIPLERRELLC
jgi:hypothetical protein